MHPVLVKAGISTILIIIFEKKFLISKIVCKNWYFVKTKSQVLNPVQANAFSFETRNTKTIEKEDFRKRFQRLSF